MSHGGGGGSLKSAEKVAPYNTSKAKDLLITKKGFKND
jgi:hypothetical protein